jgi:hypothetical protein
MRSDTPLHITTHQPHSPPSTRPPLSISAALETNALVYLTGTYEHLAAVVGFLREQ